MSFDEAIRITTEFVDTSPACEGALSHLKAGTEIRVMIEDRVECALFFSENRAVLEKRAANNPDVQFTLNLEAVRRLQTMPKDNMSALGIEICKEIVAQNISVSVCGNLMGVMRNGYITIIRHAGPDFMKFLAGHGFGSLTKIMGAIKKLRT